MTGGAYYHRNIRRNGRRLRVERLGRKHGAIYCGSPAEDKACNSIPVSFGLNLRYSLLPCRKQLSIRHFRDFVNAGRVKSQVAHRCYANFAGVLGFHSAKHGTALNYRLVEKAFGTRGCKQGGDLASTARLSEYCYIGRVASERRDIVPYPFK